MRQGGNGSGAHRDSIGADGELGDTLVGANRRGRSGGRRWRRWWRGDDRGPPGLIPSSRGRGGARRGFGAQQLGYRGLVATATMIGGDKQARPWWERARERWRGAREGWRRERRVRGTHPRRLRGSGKQEVARERGRARRRVGTQLLLLLAGGRRQPCP